MPKTLKVTEHRSVAHVSMTLCRNRASLHEASCWPGGQAGVMCK